MACFSYYEASPDRVGALIWGAPAPLQLRFVGTVSLRINSGVPMGQRPRPGLARGVAGAQGVCPRIAHGRGKRRGARDGVSHYHYHSAAQSPRPGRASLGQCRQLGRRLALDHAVAMGGSAVSRLFEETAGTVGVARLVPGTKHPTPEDVCVRLGELHPATTV